MSSGFLVTGAWSATTLALEAFMLKPLILLVLLHLICFTTARAQTLGPPINTIFIAEDIQKRPGKLELDPTSHAVLRFFDEVSFAFSRRSDVLKAVPKGNDVVLYAMIEKAQTDLSVLVDGQWHFFTVKIGKGIGLKFYEVRSRGSSPPVTPTASANATPVPTRAAGTGRIALVSPSWLRCTLEAIAVNQGEFILSYALENAGRERVIVSSNGLQLMRDGRALPFTIEARHGSVLDPGEVFAGIIRVKAPSRAVALEWNLRLFDSLDLVRLEARVP
jgi:hypothetical protein